jgi:hypothetical protein
MAITGWLSAGHALLFGLFWLLLSIPESNVAMLVASALLVVTMALLFGWVEAVGVLAWRGGWPARELPRRAIRATPGVWLGAALFVVVSYLVTHAGVWWRGHQGETDAWLMLHLGWANTRTFHAGVRGLLAFVRFAGLSLALSLASAIVAAGFRAIRDVRWVCDGIRPLRLLMIAAILLLFVWLPWRGVNWRPAWLTPNWEEAVFVALKLGVIYLIANVGWALVLGAAAKRQ